MKKIIFNFSLIFVFLFLSLIGYLSIFGIETNKFNKQISFLVSNFNKDFRVELKTVKLILEPFNLRIKAKTVGTRLKIKEKSIDLENLQSNISIKSFLKKEFLISNLKLSTKSIEIKSLISFLKKLKNSPELFILEKFINKGFLIADINMEFDENGKIKDNYQIKGIIRDGKLSIFKKFEVKKIDLIFDIYKSDYIFKDIQMILNKVPLNSEEIIIKKINDKFSVKGNIKNNKVKLNSEDINEFKKIFNIGFPFKNIDFNSNNQFSFIADKRLKINNLNLKSKIQINDLILSNNYKLKQFLPKIKNEVILSDHQIELNYDEKVLNIEGNGEIFTQDEKDTFNYQVIRNENKYDFVSSLIFKKNPLIIDILGYKKEINSDAILKLNGTYFIGGKSKINSFSFIEKKNKFTIKKLVLDKNFSIETFKGLSFHYFDNDKRQNNITIIKDDKNFLLKGPKLNINSLIDKILFGENSKNFDLFNKNFKILVDINELYLDPDHTAKNLKGYIVIENNEIAGADLDALFDNKEKFKFTINSSNNQKVTTLFTDKAQPIIKRYKFIKGFENGSLDFYSSKKDDETLSTLKIYNFKLSELPILTKILTLASLQGIADILSGEGITFDEFEMNFKQNKKGIVIDEIYAIGPAISILMDGYLVKNKLISLRGTLVPATTINKVIGSIPILGKILVGKKTGEGVFGVSFKIKGSTKNPKTTVNPIKTLTPRFITRTLEKLKKN